MRSGAQASVADGLTSQDIKFGILGFRFASDDVGVDQFLLREGISGDGACQGRGGS